ncbi:hypothetical protein HPB48_021451 [Haemaphysalis longicornis]|uniref:Uncharacterized protein n=1 Tax=Haemaphysalis longicornis TaxID=44386 RepID=A0A9J6GCV7_HAELO|nr:hypothetical protein HPB48_021451 [Haemaphysalis longicornis]
MAAGPRESFEIEPGWLLSHSRKSRRALAELCPTSQKTSQHPSVGAAGISVRQYADKTMKAQLHGSTAKATGIGKELETEDILRAKPQQNTLVMSTPSLARAAVYGNIQELSICGISYEVMAYAAPPKDTAKAPLQMGENSRRPGYGEHNRLQLDLIRMMSPGRPRRRWPIMTPQMCDSSTQVDLSSNASGRSVSTQTAFDEPPSWFDGAIRDLEQAEKQLHGAPRGHPEHHQSVMSTRVLLTVAAIFTVIMHFAGTWLFRSMLSN